VSFSFRKENLLPSHAGMKFSLLCGRTSFFSVACLAIVFLLSKRRAPLESASLSPLLRSPETPVPPAQAASFPPRCKKKRLLSVAQFFGPLVKLLWKVFLGISLCVVECPCSIAPESPSVVQMVLTALLLPARRGDAQRGGPSFFSFLPPPGNGDRVFTLFFLIVRFSSFFQGVVRYLLSSLCAESQQFFPFLSPRKCTLVSILGKLSGNCLLFFPLGQGARPSAEKGAPFIW